MDPSRSRSEESLASEAPTIMPSSDRNYVAGWPNKLATPAESSAVTPALTYADAAFYAQEPVVVQRAEFPDISYPVSARSRPSMFNSNVLLHPPRDLADIIHNYSARSQLQPREIPPLQQSAPETTSLPIDSGAYQPSAPIAPTTSVQPTSGLGSLFQNGISLARPGIIRLNRPQGALPVGLDGPGGPGDPGGPGGPGGLGGPGNPGGGRLGNNGFQGHQPAGPGGPPIFNGRG